MALDCGGFPVNVRSRAQPDFGGTFGGGGATAVTWNSADKNANIALSELDKRYTRSGGSQWAPVRGTVSHDAADAGGFYFEAVVVDDSTSTTKGIMLGIGTSAASIADGAFPGSDANGRCYYANGQTFASGSPTTYGSVYVPGDNIGTLLKNGKLYFRKNGAWQNSANPDVETGAAFTGLTGLWFPMGAAFYTGLSSVRAIPRAYPLPAGAGDWVP